MKHIAIFLAEGFEEVEALTVVDICRRAGLKMDMVSVGGSRQVTSSHKVTVCADKMLAEVNFDELDMIVLPGGMPGTGNLEACEELMEQLDAFYNGGKYLAAICAAPSIFGHRGFLTDRKACCYPGFESHLTGAKVSADQVSVDGNVITSRGLGTAIPFALAIAGIFCGAGKAEEIAKGIVYA